MRTACVIGLVLLGCVSGASGGVVQVGPGRTYTTVAAGYNAASAGDTIEIDSATYTGSAGWVSISKNNLTFRGVGPTRPVLDAAGGNLGDKGIFVVSANTLTVENLEFKNTVGPSMNDAGIRYQPPGSPAALTVRNCYFHDNQDGVLGGTTSSDVTFENTEFNHNGAGDGQSHNMYITANVFTLRYCYVHNAVVGHEVKTRALNNYILYNRIASENGSGSRELQLANGGPSYVIGNMIQQGNFSENSQIITYGDEGANPNLNLYIVNNSIVNERDNGGTFISTRSGTTAVIQNNIFKKLSSGTQTILSGPGSLISNWETTNAGFVNQAAFDYHLTAASTGAINLGTAPGTGFNGVSLVPIYQYVHPCDKESRPSDGVLDIGAYEYVTPNQAPTVDAGADQTAYEGQTVHLHATASDPDSDPLTYDWTQTAGLTVALSGANTSDASFTAPAVSTVAQANMTFRVTVNDGKGGTANDSVNVRVYLAGDATHNDVVDVSDLLAVAAAYASSVGDPRYNPACDFNGDGLVDVADLLLLANNWGKAL